MKMKRKKTTTKKFRPENRKRTKNKRNKRLQAEISSMMLLTRTMTLSSLIQKRKKTSFMHLISFKSAEVTLTSKNLKQIFAKDKKYLIPTTLRIWMMPPPTWRRKTTTVKNPHINNFYLG